MVRIMLFSLVLALCSALMADITQYYTFSSDSLAYTDINGTAQTGAQGDDVMSTPIDIGFSFVYGTNTYTQVLINSNGYICLGGTGTSTNVNSIASTTVCPIIAGLWDDLHTGRTASTINPVTSSVQTLASGTTPHCKFTVQYTNAYWDYATDPHNSYVDFQIVLSENGTIDIKFGPNSATNPRPQAGASIGINMLPGRSGNFFSVTPGSPATASTTVAQDSIRIHIPNGTCYHFSPPEPNDLAATQITGSLTPTFGINNNYTITVFNNGAIAQSNYTVSLMSGINELSSVSGSTINPLQSLPVIVPWMPTATGPVTLYGKVTLTGDANPANDQTPPIDVVVQSPPGTLTGHVYYQGNFPLHNAIVTVDTLSATTTTDGVYLFHLQGGSYSVTCTHAGYQPQTINNVEVNSGLITVQNFYMLPVPNSDNVLTATTALKGNYPNPFLSQTTVSYEVKHPGQVQIDVFNTKGQFITTLVREPKSSGTYSVSWDGRDAKGKAVSSGLYECRMQTGEYRSTHYMLLMK